jgi:hypothetical protein
MTESIRIAGETADGEAVALAPLIRSVVRDGVRRAYAGGRGDPNIFAAVIAARIDAATIAAALQEAEGARGPQNVGGNVGL